MGRSRERLEEFRKAFAGERVVSPIGEALVARKHGSYLRRGVRSESRLCRPSTTLAQLDAIHYDLDGNRVATLT